MWKKIRAYLAAARRGANCGKCSSGLWGEQTAAAALRRSGYRIIARRLRVGRRDEIDIIARRAGTLVFVEVKTRRAEDFGRPAAAVDARKRHCLSRAAIRYMRALPRPPVRFRFDVVEIIGGPDTGRPAVRHIENAFALSRRYRPL